MVVVNIIIVTVSVGVLVAIVGADSPRLVAIDGDEGPTVHLAFPILVEDNNQASVDHIVGSGNAAVVIAFLHGDGLQRQVGINVDRLGVNR